MRLAAGWLVGHPRHTATAYRRDLAAWASWCAQLGLHPLGAERHHVDAWVRHLTTTPQPRTGRPASAATVARTLSALSSFYGYGVHDAGVLTHSPVASVRRPPRQAWIQRVHDQGSSPLSPDDETGDGLLAGADFRPAARSGRNTPQGAAEGPYRSCGAGPAGVRDM